MTRAASVCLAALLTIGSTAPHASDWPEFRGEGRRGVWTETGILEKFPEGGLTVRWRTPINLGYSGPAVADGRVVHGCCASLRLSGNRIPYWPAATTKGEALARNATSAVLRGLSDQDGRMVLGISWTRARSSRVTVGETVGALNAKPGHSVSVADRPRAADLPDLTTPYDSAPLGMNPGLTAVNRRVVGSSPT